MSDDQFTRLFKYMQQNFTQIREEIANLSLRVDSVYGLVDKNIKQHEING